MIKLALGVAPCPALRAKGHAGGGGLAIGGGKTRLIGCEIYSNTANSAYAGCMTPDDCGRGGGILIGGDIGALTTDVQISGTEIYSNIAILVRACLVNLSSITPSQTTDDTSALTRASEGRWHLHRGRCDHDDHQQGAQQHLAAGYRTE